MRVMVIVKATKESEAGVMPSEELLAAMGKYNEELVKAGAMLAGEGLHPSMKGKRVRFAGSTRTVSDGPFAETKGLIAGFWLWQVKSMEEAVEWVRRCPNPMPTESEIEIRPVFEAEDFGAEFTPELRAQEERLRAKADRLAPARQADRANRRESSMPTLQRITPCLWFDRQAEEAAKLYTSMFRNSRIGAISRYGEAGREIHGMPAGTVLTVAFELDGHSFTALNGGPQFTFNEAISLQVNCDSQEEVDYYWNGLSAGGDPRFQQCGWLKDRFGLSWQVVPTVLPRLMTDPDPKKSERVMTALLGMKKLDIAVLEKAHAG